jgi:hypothetical protein
MISALIKENRELHRQIDKLSNQTVGAASKTAERACGRSSAVCGAAWTITRRPVGGRSAAATSAPRRRVTDPDLLQRRRQALAKAREAWAAKRAAAQQ